jgi:hypothetical protein
MPSLIPTISVGVSREINGRNQTIFPPIGEMFEFTAEEVKQIRAAAPEGLRRPINETGSTKPAPKEEVTSEEEETSEEETVEEETTHHVQSGRPLTPQQQRQAAAAQRRAAARHGGRGGDDDL